MNLLEMDFCYKFHKEDPDPATLVLSKAMKKPHAEALVRGESISIGSFEMYRTMEDTSRTIGDTRDGVVDYGFAVGSATADQLTQPQREMIGFYGDSDRYRNSVLRQCSFAKRDCLHAYTFCTSLSMTKAMLQKYAEDPDNQYDAVVRITNPIRLASLLACHLNALGAPLKRYEDKLFFHMRTVVYDQSPAGRAVTGTPPLPFAFKKRPDFAWQREYRILFPVHRSPIPNFKPSPAPEAIRPYFAECLELLDIASLPDQ